MRVCPATPADLPAIAAIYNDEVLHGVATFDIDPWPADRFVQWLADRQRPGRMVIVAADDAGRVLGYAALSDWAPKIGYARSAENSIYIHKDHRARGLGRTLLGDLIARARAAGVANIMARIESTQAVSLRLHEQRGFRRVGRLPRIGEKFGRVLDVDILQLSLEAQR